MACLLRRLYDRLGSTPDSVACVGTSATIGGKQAREALATFASQVFGQAFPDDAFVGEDRLLVAEAFPPPEDTERVLVTSPFDDRERKPWAHELDPAGEPERYLLAASQAWFDERVSDPAELGERLARHVFLRRLLEALHLLDQPVVESVAKLRREAGGDLLVIGSTELASLLLDHDLVDELRLMIDPVILGGGKRFFRDDGVCRRLALVASETISTGAILATYARVEADPRGEAAQPLPRPPRDRM